MNINIKTTNFEMTEQIQDYLDKKLSSINKLLTDYDDSSIARIEIGRSTMNHKSGFVFRAETTLSFDGEQVRAVSEKEDLHQAIDEMRDDLVREIDKIKDKKITMVKKGGQKAKEMLHENGEEEKADESSDGNEYE